MTVGDWLREARLSSGMSLIDIVVKLRELPPSLWMSTDTVRRLERIPGPDPVRAAALAVVYGRAPEEWPEELREQVDQVKEVLAGSPSSG